MFLIVTMNLREHGCQYLICARCGRITVVLINNYRVLHLIHSGIQKSHSMGMT